MQPQQFYCLQSVVEEAARWRFLRLGCGCGQEAAALAKLDSTDKSPGCRAPYGLQLRVEQATRHEMGHVLLQSLQATSLIAKQRETGEVKRNFGNIQGNMHRIYGWEYVKNTIWHYDILLTGIYIMNSLYRHIKLLLFALQKATRSMGKSANGLVKATVKEVLIEDELLKLYAY